MKHIFKIITIAILVIAMQGTVVFGADLNYRFMHNDHDTLVIGEITEINDTIIIDVADFVVSSQDLNANAARPQMRPEIVEVNAGDLLNAFGVGDFVIASLNSDGDMFTVAWGIFSVSSLDTKTLEVFAGDVFSSAMLTDFVNSEGRFTNFSVDGSLGRVIRHYGDADIVIYDENPPGIQARMPIMADLGDEAEGIEAVRQNLPAENNNPLTIVVMVLIIAALAISGFLKIRKLKQRGAQ